MLVLIALIAIPAVLIKVCMYETDHQSDNFKPLY